MMSRCAFVPCKRKIIIILSQVHHDDWRFVHLSRGYLCGRRTVGGLTHTLNKQTPIGASPVLLVFGTGSYVGMVLLKKEEYNINELLI